MTSESKLKELARKIIALETKLSDPNEKSFIIKCREEDIDAIDKALSGSGRYVLSMYTPTKIFAQAYLPWDASVSDVELHLWNRADINAQWTKVSILQPGRARCFPVAVARQKFVEYMERCEGATREELMAAKALAYDMEASSFPVSERFVID